MTQIGGGTLLVLSAIVALTVWRLRCSRRGVLALSERVESLLREAAALRRGMARIEADAEADRRYVKDFLRELPHVTRGLHSGVAERRIPALLLNAVTRALPCEQAVVLLRRRSNVAGQAPPRTLVVAAASHPGRVPLGSEAAFGSGDLGFVADVQRVMTRHELEAQTLLTRARLQEDSLAGIEVDLAAPMVFGEETLGVIALSGLRSDSVHAKDALRVVAQMGSLALHNAAAYSDLKLTAEMDGLTQVYNKRCVTLALGEEIHRARQRASSVSIFLFDIDSFKHYNDTNGHEAGDQLLRLLARFVRGKSRSENIFGRFGGEEFLLVLPETTFAQALRAAETLRAAIAAHPFPHREKQPLGCVSISGGVAAFPANAQDSASLLRSADGALYAAKRAGRNRVLGVRPRCLGESETPPAAQSPRKPDPVHAT